MDAPADTPTPPRPSTWREELSGTVRLALSLVFVQVGIMLMGVVDNIMVGHVSREAYAAVALGHSVSMALLLFAFGILMALDPLVSQAWGARDLQSVARNVRHGFILALLLTPVTCVLMWDAEWLLRLLGQNQAIMKESAGYIRIVSASNIALLGFVVLRQSLQAMGIVRPMLISIIIANLFNVLGNWALVYGNLGFPKMGVSGSACATASARWLLLLGTILATLPQFRRLGIRIGTIVKSDWNSVLRILSLGFPIGVQVCLEVWAFVGVTLMMGAWGVTQLAGNNIALNLASLVFMVPLGISMAATARVGQAIGRRDMSAARRSAGVSLVLSVITQLTFAIAFVAFPHTLATLYSNDDTVIQVAVTLLPIAAAFQVFDALQAVSAGILRGGADTRTPAVIAFIGYWVLGLPCGYLLAHHTTLEYRGFWWGLTISLGLVATALLYRVHLRLGGDIQRIQSDAADA